MVEEADVPEENPQILTFTGTKSYVTISADLQQDSLQSPQAGIIEM